MKKIQFAILFIFYIAIKSVHAQVDTLNEKSNIPENQLNEKVLKHKQEYLDLNFREEKTLVKLGISSLYVKYDAEPDTFSDGTTMDFNRGWLAGTFELEQKISPSFSFSYGNALTFGFAKKEPVFSFAGGVDFRYYYQIKKRIAQSIGANNFHSNYFSIALSGIYIFQSYDFKDYQNPNYTGRVTEWKSEPSLIISWGMQRRIGKWGFFGVSPYLGFNFGDNYYNHFYYGAALQLGLAWGK